jgi:hypothetical protein
VRSTPHIKLTAATRGRGKLRVSVLVTAPGVAPVTGTVLVRAGRTVLGELTLRGGHATRLWLGRPAGTVPVTVRYRSGMSTFAAAASTVAHVR